MRLLTKQGAEVQVIMTDSAKTFVGPLTFSTLSGKSVLSDLSSNDQWSKHVELGLWADLMIVAPASANTMAKLAHGITDNLLTAVYLSARCPVFIAPAMDEDMWHHPSTQKNLQALESFGNAIIPVEEGPLASGLEGKGRLAEPETILSFVLAHFLSQHLLKNKKVLITAGPTLEAIDPVRFIGNHSSGKMGIRLAETALELGAEVKLVLGPTQESYPKGTKIETKRIQSAQQMFEAVCQFMEWADVFILSAAVSDFRPEIVSSEKIKKDGRNDLTIHLIANPDIAAYVGLHKKDSQLLCGFALETENVIENAQSKLHKKNMDLIVINSPKDASSAFGFDTNKISILDKSGKLVSFDLQSKKNSAIAILKAILQIQKT